MKCAVGNIVVESLPINGNTEAGRISLKEKTVEQCAIQRQLGTTKPINPYCPPTRTLSTPVPLESTYIAAKIATATSPLCIGASSGTPTTFITTCGIATIRGNGATTQSAVIARAAAATLATPQTGVNRFASYYRWSPPPPCPPLPALATNAGAPRPSLHTCLPNKNMTMVTGSTI